MYIYIYIYNMFWMEYGNATKVGTLALWQHFATMLHTYVRSNRNIFFQLKWGDDDTRPFAKEHRDGNTIEKRQENDLNVRRTFRESQYPCVSLFVNWRHHDRKETCCQLCQLCKTSTAGSSHNMAHIVHMAVSEHGLYQKTTIALFAAAFTQGYMGSKPTGVPSDL